MIPAVWEALVTMRVLRWVVPIVVVVRLAPGQNLEITPFAAVYVPAFEVLNEFAPYFGQITVKHQSALAIGARLGIPLSHRVLLEGIVSYASSGVEVTSTGLGNGAQDASVTILGAQLAVGLSPTSSPVAVHLTAGAGTVMHGGRYWKDFETSVRNSGLTVKGMNRFALILGTDLTFVVGSLPIRTGFAALVYDSKFTFTDNVSSASTQAQLQADLHVFAGLTLGGSRNGRR